MHENQSLKKKILFCRTLVSLGLRELRIALRLWELQIAFQDVAFLQSRASSYTMCLTTVVGGKQGHAISKIP